jgi:hypothetical protein
MRDVFLAVGGLLDCIAQPGIEKLPGWRRPHAPIYPIPRAMSAAHRVSSAINFR